MSIVLPRFLPAPVWSAVDKESSLRSNRVKRVVSYVLGPSGTNIEQAAMMWHKAMGVEGKSEFVLCDLPETAVRMALALKLRGTLGVFWTCAVFAREFKMFFSNPEAFPFFFQQEMLLDEMQLAVSGRNGFSLSSNLATVKVATHISPSPLVESLRQFGVAIVDASSNAEAARMCASGEVDACMTTEAARRIHMLKKIHSFGSPNMIFFGGITPHGLRVLEGARSSA